MGLQEMERRAAELRLMFCGLEYDELMLVPMVAMELAEEIKHAALNDPQ